jgi:hypothetical protein
MAQHPAYAVYRSMIDRCRLPSHQSWRNYGGRGITVCERWQQSFENFWEDMGPTYQKGMTIERMKNSKGYSKTNCRWRSMKHQSNNRRTNVFVRTPIGRMTISQAAERYGIGRSTLDWRLKAGWSVKRALTESTT